VQPDEHRSRWIADRLAVALRAARTALGRATGVLLGHEADEGMKAAARALHELRREIEELEPARRTDVRSTVAVVHLGGDLERLAELTQQIAGIAWACRSRRPLPGHIASEVAAMSDGVLALVERAGRTAALEPTAAVDTVAALERSLGTVARQQRSFDEALVSCTPPVDEASAIDLALLGRCYESCARHAVSAAGHVAALTS
jgi:phosphate transport system protein